MLRDLSQFLYYTEKKIFIEFTKKIKVSGCNKFILSIFK